MKSAILLLSLLLSSYTYSQLIVQQAEAQYLPAYSFFGSNYQISNVQVLGDPIAFAQFDGSNSHLGLDKGFMISTGNCFDAIGPNNSDDKTTDITFNHPPGLLDSISNGATLLDVAYLEFDLVPSVDSLVFNYVFASEEYTEFVGSQFQDVMGIFIEGPGINGFVDLAVLPNGDKVSINNIHGNISNNFGTFQAQNDNFYVDNPPFSPINDPMEIQYDGYTQGTIAKITGLQTGGTYKVTIGIADAEDGLFDSTIFLEACESCNYTLESSEHKMVSVSVSPNPARDEIKVTAEGVHHYQILELTGKVLQSGSFQNDHILDISTYESGAYLIKLEGGSAQRFVKQ